MTNTNDNQREQRRNRDEKQSASRPEGERSAAAGPRNASPQGIGSSSVQSNPEVDMGLGALTKAAGVSTRTVRYYIAEGLLPPPIGAGPRTTYTPAHLDRLRLIGRLKDAYLPLREIRRRLDALTDHDVKRLLRTSEEEGPQNAQPDPLAIPRGLAVREPPDTAADYLARVRQGSAENTRPRPSRAIPSADEGRLEAPDADPALWMSAEIGEAATADAVLEAAVPPIPLPAPPESRLPETQQDAWRRVPLGDDAELLIRESLYRRKRDRVEWLVAWARRVFR